MKLPFIQLYWAEYQADTRCLSAAARGIWMDVMIAVHNSATRGQLTRPVVAWSRICSVSPEQMGAAIAELEQFGTADVTHECNGDVTLVCRRMANEQLTREQTRQRVERHRLKEANNAAASPEKTVAASSVTTKIEIVTGHKSEVRSQNTESNPPNPPCGGKPAAPAGAPAGPSSAVTEPSNPTEKKPPDQPTAKAASPPPATTTMPFTSAAFVSAWSDWLAYRRERRLPLPRPRSLAAQSAQFTAWGEAATITAIRDSIRNNWQGLFEPKSGQGHANLKPSRFEKAF